MRVIKFNTWLKYDELNEEKISDDEIKKVLKGLETEKGWYDGDDKEKVFHIKEDSELPERGNVSSDTKGKLHELLVGYHLLGGRHMSKHVDKEGDSPSEAHDKLKSSVHPDDYRKMNAKAKSAAAHIKKSVEVGGHKIHDVHWTSKPGDLHRSTGIHASQQEDASDIVVTTRKK
jgi:hypothetical protein